MQILNQEQTLSPPACTFLSSSFSISSSLSSMMSPHPSEIYYPHLHLLSPVFILILLSRRPSHFSLLLHTFSFFLSSLSSMPQHSKTSSSLIHSLFPISYLSSITQLHLCCFKSRKLYGVGVPYLPQSYFLFSYLRDSLVLLCIF